MGTINIWPVVEQVLILFFTMFAGIAAKKAGIFSDSTVKNLSSFLLNITQPLMIITSFQISYTPELLRHGIFIFAASAATHVIASLAAHFSFIPVKNSARRTVMRFGTVFVNCAFIGYPVLKVVFEGDLGIFYGAFYSMFFNIYVWTYGIHLFDNKNKSKKDSIKRIFINPGIISTVIGLILFAAQINLPGPLYSSMKLVGDMTFPLSMVIIGAVVCSVNITSVLKKFETYYYVIFNLIIKPLFVAFICIILRLDNYLIFICAIMAAMPTAANTAIFAEVNNSDSALASQLVGITTFCSLATIPLVLYVVNLFMNFL